MDKACKFSSIVDYCFSNFILFIEIHIGTFEFDCVCGGIMGTNYWVGKFMEFLTVCSYFNLHGSITFARQTFGPH